MRVPDKPVDEAARLEALHRLNVLDTEPEERFDRLTRLARRVFNVPIAVVSLVDTERQWFKSAAGLDVIETPRDVSFCGHAILGDQILMICDAVLDERFYDNPLVLGDPGIRFYAGCPLKVANGDKVGTLCLIDTLPRVLRDDERELLRDLAAMAEQELVAVQLATMDELTLLPTGAASKPWRVMAWRIAGNGAGRRRYCFSISMSSSRSMTPTATPKVIWPSRPLPTCYASRFVKAM